MMAEGVISYWQDLWMMERGVLIGKARSGMTHWNAERWHSLPFL